MIEVQDEGSQARRAADRRRARRAGGRSLRRRRRQDPVARGHDGEPRPDLRDRSRQAPPRADPRPARTRRPPATCRSARRAAGGARLIRSPISHGRNDLVVIDAPCTGTGTWRRNPDAKWRIRPGALTQRVAEQIEVLDRAAALVKPGGRIGYITCSVLAEEGPDQVAAFLSRHTEFRPEPAPNRTGTRRRRRGFRDCGPDPRPRPPDDATPDRHRRIFCEHPAPRGVIARYAQPPRFPPRPACGERSDREAIRVRGPLRTVGACGSAPSPDFLRCARKSTSPRKRGEESRRCCTFQSDSFPGLDSLPTQH